MQYNGIKMNNLVHLWAFNPQGTGFFVKHQISSCPSHSQAKQQLSLIRSSISGSLRRQWTQGCSGHTYIETSI